MLSLKHATQLALG